MADLLTHMLVAFTLVTIASWAVDWLDRRAAVLAMGGAAIPDLTKVDLLLDADTVETALGVPFSYSPLSTLGGVFLVAALLTLAFDRALWPRVYGLFVVGGVSALVLDGLRAYADGQASAWLYPFTNWRPPTPSLYVSSDPRVLVFALLVTGVVFIVDQRVGRA